MTSMYDAEYGRASGVVVNAVTKSGTNQFKGVAFLSAASNRLTSKDFLVKQGNLTKPTTTKRDWGGVLGGPVVRNKAHFFVSLERQVDNPTRTRVYPTRPELSFSTAEQRSGWNTMVRFDHQVNATHTWAARYLRESAPQFPIVGNRQTIDSTSDETDIDEMLVGTLTSVFGNSRVNTVRVAKTWEHWWHGNACTRALGFENEVNLSQCPPQLDQISFLGQASTEAQGPWDCELPDRGSLLLVRPRQERGPRPEVRRALQLHRARTGVADRAERPVPVQYRSAVRRGQSADLSRTVDHPGGRVLRVHQQSHGRAVRAGQVEDGRTHDAERRNPLRSRDHPAQRGLQPAVPGRATRTIRSIGTTSRRESASPTRSIRRARRSFAAATGCSTTEPCWDRSTTRWSRGS